MSQRLAFFGGTFDPVHHGHLIIARSIAELCGFDRITLVPASVPPHKSPSQASAQDRLTMLKLAIAGQSGFDLCDLELFRQGPSYTMDTLQALRAQHGPDAELFWIIGADMIKDLPKWNRAKELPDLVTFVIAARPPYQQQLDQSFRQLENFFTPRQVQQFRQFVAPSPLIEISSTQVRQRVAAGLPISYLVPPAVEQYIHGHRLYLA